MNIICVMSDSLRRDHLGCYGNEWIQTPNLDRFAKTATVFDMAFQSSHPTIPNRTDLFSGRYSFPWHGWQPLDTQARVMSQIFGEQGYETCLIGDTYHMFKEGYYFQRGFDGWLWNRGQEGDPLVRDATIPIEFPCAPEKIRQPYPDRYPQIIRNRYHRRVETDWFAPGTMTTAMDWLEKNRSCDRFLLWIDCFDPHEPWDPPQHYIDLYDPDYDLTEDCDYPEGAPCTFLSKRELKHTQARYAGEVTMVDRWFGKLLDQLELLRLADNTAVFFMADHGHYLNYPTDGGLIGKPLRYKDELYPMYQSLINIPFLCRVPGAKARRVRQVVQPPDLLPTLMELTGIDEAGDFHGQSFVPALHGRKADTRRYAFSAQYSLVANVTSANWSYGCWPGGCRKPVLFDLKSDPNQKRSVAARHPQVAKRMHGELRRFLNSVGAPEETVAAYALEGS